MGLRGQTHVAVINACNDGRLTPPAVHRNGRSWIINAELADEQWATRTDPSEYGGMGGGTARRIGPPELAPQPTPASKATAGQLPPAAKGGPSLAVSKQVKAAYEAKICELDFKQRNGELVVARDVKSQAFTLARAVRDGMMGIADRLAPQLAAATDPRQVHALLTTEIRVALRALADG